VDLKRRTDREPQIRLDHGGHRAAQGGLVEGLSEGDRGRLQDASAEGSQLLAVSFSAHWRT
jgi:hypothetical protein